MSTVCYPSSPSVSLNRLAVTIQRVAQQVRGPRPELWRCQACGAAGSIYDLASLVLGGPWGRGQLSDDAFRRARAYVLDIYGELT